ncbi:hypothetical protein IEQ34_000490 [Dendrobium chrysotoxum]|uniref:Uncharacterized protein n=1 Tax=Dendrobium chrysotoxum TaxID=161865 RepID=A0AAV7HQK7_DENCH|nr:hypothetical protein IEQ34_000490 [Dendrobium chrysotoxum]
MSESQFNQILNIELDRIIEICKLLDEQWSCILHATHRQILKDYDKYESKQAAVEDPLNVQNAPRIFWPWIMGADGLARERRRLGGGPAVEPAAGVERVDGGREGRRFWPWIMGAGGLARERRRLGGGPAVEPAAGVERVDGGREGRRFVVVGGMRRRWPVVWSPKVPPVLEIWSRTGKCWVLQPKRKRENDDLGVGFKNRIGPAGPIGSAVNRFEGRPGSALKTGCAPNWPELA